MSDHLKSPLKYFKRILVSKEQYDLIAGLVLLSELVLNTAIIKYVRYTEIDWIAYMQQIRSYSLGERNYLKLKGDTGPLVVNITRKDLFLADGKNVVQCNPDSFLNYPAGFVHVYSVLYSLTQQGQDVKLAQYLFGAIYLITMGCVLAIYKRCESLPTYAIFSLILSKRMHSIYVLRLFNDGIAMMGLYVSIWCLVTRRWNWSALWFSLALSIKMNILLFFPALGFIYFQTVGVLKTINLMLIIVLVQAWLAIPFLLEFPREYLSKAFEFKRVFEYQWTVNWRMVPQSTFLSSGFASSLTLLHLSTLVWFAWTRWSRASRGDSVISLLVRGLRNWNRPAATRPDQLTPDYIVKVCFTSNLIGIICARTLHYQFYSWYAHQIVFLAWQTPYPIFLR
ncbi:dolichyl-P-Man:Man(5)GlcNAc(2)-PP-dolichol alpha-1,3-mannosyltransferase [Puccinia graminis f. sp. tritici]|uniref:Dol-P-Man:Man(5)GlcNAc(2)-PP-Dol alpha-1,3-mannosyltransferase n=1 Tax=Puccinia graminis f. sp. tritici TaxID=56615 RepID=A0A5B0RGX2_PUCGR|nr:dolichyl-P-Man:Man(5)GlcNAc(2)-PP-dolichol alpha-1,3-mannosyltransferase [Puccinia graminis f. sp. tritici]